ncbi:MAG: hypothetical protein ACYTGN_05235 [Planctomycetota bacterium]|jgi:hypothetical protein
MGDRAKDFSDYLERLARSPGDVPPEDLSDDEARRARRLLEAARRAAEAPELSRRARKAALKAFRAESAPDPGRLCLVFDSWAQAGQPVRTSAQPVRRFLRFEGNVSVDMQVTPAERGVDVRGHVDPANATPAVILRCEGRERSATVSPDGTFVLRRVSNGIYTLLVGRLRFEGIQL